MEREASFGSKENPNKYQAQRKRIVFLEKALGEGVLEKVGLTQRDQDIGLLYNLTRMVLDEVGEIFPNPSGEPLAKERVREINRIFLMRIWLNVSQELRASCSLEEFRMGKPSLHKNGPTLKVIEEIERRNTNPRRIIEMTGISSSVFNSTKKTLKKWGIEIPLPYSYAYFKKRIEEEDDDSKLSGILNDYTDGSLMGCIGHRKKDPDMPLMYLHPLIREAGFHPEVKFLNLFFESIKGKGIPVRKIISQRYSEKKGKITLVNYIVLKKHRQRITDAINNDPSLQKFLRH